MRSFSVKFQLLGLTTLIMVTMLILGGAGYMGASNQGETLFDMDLKMSALRYDLETDKIHADLWADVMTARYASLRGDTEGVEAAQSKFKRHAAALKRKFSSMENLQISDTLTAMVVQAQDLIETFIASGSAVIEMSLDDHDAAEELYGDFMVQFNTLKDTMSELSEIITNNADEASLIAQDAAETTLQQMVWIISVSAFVGIVGSLLVLVGILRPLKKLNRAIVAIGKDDGNLQRIHGFGGEFRAIERSFNTVLDGLETKNQAESQRAQAALRVQEALNSATTNVVLSDAEGNVIYVNETARQMFTNAQAQIHKTLPAFNLKALTGTALTSYFPDKGMGSEISATTTERKDEIKLGDNTYSVISTAVRDRSGSRLGVVCEWTDLTEQREAERQIENILHDAMNGQLNTRLDSDRFHGFMSTLSRSVNDMLDAITDPLEVAARQLKSIAEGQIPDPIKTEFKGTFNDIRINLNTCCDVLKTLVQDSMVLSTAAAEGMLEERVDVKRHWGDFRSIVEGMNNTLDAISAPVTEVKDVISGFASGDLSNRMSTNFKGDFAVLSQAVNSSIENLVEMVSQINTTSFNINTSAMEISSGNQDLNERTQEQAAALEETTATIHNLTERSEENTNNAKSANDLAQSATQEAQHGGKIVQNAVLAMSDINAASTKIADIITVIDGIAFQTNLLALNASVEAARAGEQGRGFAVVAEEVRQLAGRSANAAAEIKQLINDTVEKVHHGSRLVNESGDTLQDIVSSIGKVGNIISEISAATAEQMDGFIEVSRAINQLDDMTQQNAAMVEEAAAASESMADQSGQLKELVSFFRVDGRGRDRSNVSRRSNRPNQGPQSSGKMDGFSTDGRAQKGKTPVLTVVSNPNTDAQWAQF